jgi:nitrogen regulatory protein P-II
MKMLFMIYDVDFDDDVMDVLSTCCVTGYTKWGRVLGKGERSEPKMDDSVWPGFNSAIMMAVESDLEQQVFEALQSLHKRMGGKALKVFGWPLERMI